MTGSTEADDIKRVALQCAVEFLSVNGEAGIDDVILVATEFESYLRSKTSGARSGLDDTSARNLSYDPDSTDWVMR